MHAVLAPMVSLFVVQVIPENTLFLHTDFLINLFRRPRHCSNQVLIIYPLRSHRHIIELLLNFLHKYLYPSIFAANH